MSARSTPRKKTYIQFGSNNLPFVVVKRHGNGIEAVRNFNRSITFLEIRCFDDRSLAYFQKKFHYFKEDPRVFFPFSAPVP